MSCIDFKVSPAPVSAGEPAAARPVREGSDASRAAFCYLRRLHSPQELAALAALAASDNHAVLAPTHLVERDGEIVGYGSIGAVMMLHTWLHSQKVRARDSLALLNLAENLAAELPPAQPQEICCPCAPQSPFQPFMPRLGFRFVGSTGLYVKPLRKD